MHIDVSHKKHCETLQKLGENKDFEFWWYGHYGGILANVFSCDSYCLESSYLRSVHFSLWGDAMLFRFHRPRHSSLCHGKAKLYPLNYGYGLIFWIMLDLKYESKSNTQLIYFSLVVVPSAVFPKSGEYFLPLIVLHWQNWNKNKFVIKDTTS